MAVWLILTYQVRVTYESGALIVENIERSESHFGSDWFIALHVGGDNTGVDNTYLNVNRE